MTHDAVEPAPRECIISIAEPLRYVKSKAAASRTRARSALEHLDDLENAVLGRLTVHGDGDLTSASTMDSATLKRQCDWLVHRQVVHSRNAVRRRVVGRGLAREVGTISLERRVVEVGDVERDRRGHLHVGVGHTEKSEDNNGHEAEVEAEGHDGEDERSDGCLGPGDKGSTRRT